VIQLRLLSLCAAVALLTGCGSGSMPAALELWYDEELAKAGFPSPLLRGTIHGRAVWFIIDTGAGVHTLASWLVKATGIVTHTTRATTRGSTGVESAVRAVYGESIQVNGCREDIPLREAIVVDLPPILEEQRIGGLLSPQLLAPANMAAILDLQLPRLSFGNAPVASAGTHVCRNGDSQFANRLYAAPMSADNLTGVMLIDTGATGSVAVPSSRIATALANKASETGHTRGVGGTVTSARKVPNVALRFGGGEALVSLSIGGAPPTCGADGLLGMDALRLCRLVLGESTFAWSCHPE
jgi:hypothetical protein